MRAGLAIAEEETIRNRVDNYRKCRETEYTRDRDFKIRQDTRTPDHDMNTFYGDDLAFFQVALVLLSMDTL